MSVCALVFEWTSVLLPIDCLLFVTMDGALADVCRLCYLDKFTFYQWNNLMLRDNLKSTMKPVWGVSVSPEAKFKILDYSYISLQMFISSYNSCSIVTRRWCLYEKMTQYVGMVTPWPLKWAARKWGPLLLLPLKLFLLPHATMLSCSVWHCAKQDLGKGQIMISLFIRYLAR